MNEGKSRNQVLVEALIYLGANLALVWTVLPPDQKMWLRLRWASATRRLLGGLAAREGRAGMADELRGGSELAGGPRYAAAYWLAVARDRLTGAIRP